ncbi:hypothetical protein [Burkholderia stabilis]
MAGFSVNPGAMATPGILTYRVSHVRNGAESNGTEIARQSALRRKGRGKTLAKTTAAEAAVRMNAVPAERRPRGAQPAVRRHQKR